jgi:hypothetical protein
MRKIFLPLLCLFVYYNSYAGNNDTVDILNAATSGLKVYLAKIPVGKEKNYGFANSDEIAQAELGVPVDIFILSPDFFSASTIVKERNYITSIEEWLVPVTVNGEWRALLTVSKKNGSWKTVGFGSSFLAADLNKIITENTNLKRQQYSLLRVYQLDCDFILEHNSFNINNWKVIPLSSAKKAFKIPNTKTEDHLPDVYQMIKQKAQK